MKTLRIHVLQHVAFEGPAAIGDWAAYNGHVVTSTHFFVKNAQVPALDAFDVLVIMGGPMGVHDALQYTWLKPEMEFVRNSIEAGKKVLGVCLGAQIMAHVLGAQVTRNPEREIGWFPVHRASNLPKLLQDAIPEECIAFHWHGETFSLPENAVLLSSSKACANQGFLWKNSALGLQYHLETTAASAEALLANAGADLVKPGEFIQSPDTIRSGAKDNASSLNRSLNRLLDAWIAL